ncbi:MAG: TetR/AcrR family transcriptional regulator [Clostridiales Family XIII bacterium]|jgi:AcrR family transcriptional regulator|nr:TetR/AcrR family transcriptional regulator [Clostridiales Family XIII bacterium]
MGARDRGNREESRQCKKERILDAAFRIFVERGYAQAKMCAIARRAGCGKSTLYDYFSGKDEIFDELLRTKLIDPYLALSDAIVEQSSASAKLRALLNAEIDLLLEYSRDKNLLPAIMTNPESFMSPVLRNAVNDSLSHKFMLVLGIVEEGMESGEFREGNPTVSAIQIIGASNAFASVLAKTAFSDQLPSVSNDDAAREAFFLGIFQGLSA